MHVCFPPDLLQQCHPSIHVDQGICGFPSRLSHEDFTRGFPTGLTHVPPWCESILGCKSSQCRENRFPWNALRHWGTVGMVARSWSSSRHSCGERLLLRCEGTLGILSRPRSKRIPPLELGGGNGAPLHVGGTLVLPLEWRRVCRATS